ALYRGADEFYIPKTISGMPLHYLQLVQNSNLLFASNSFRPSIESTSLTDLESVYNVYDYPFEYSQLSGIEWSLSDLIRIDYRINSIFSSHSYFIDIEAIEVIFSDNPFVTQNNSQYLYISGPNQSSGNLNLRTLGGNPNKSVNLLINGSSSVNNIAKLRPI